MEELYKEYSRLVYNYLKSLCGDKETAEELTQETFYRAIKGVNKFKGDCKVSTWLCQIAKNVWKTHLSKEKRKKVVSIDDEIDLSTMENIQDNVEDRIELINMYKEIHKLDEKTREVFYLRLKGELTFKEIGEILGKTEQWARITFYRGKIKLKEILKGKESD